MQHRVSQARDPTLHGQSSMAELRGASCRQLEPSQPVLGHTVHDADVHPAGMEGDRTFKYFAYGAACSEAELDCLTGAWRLRRVDIVMDVGRALAPNLDIGQIEGAVTQGIGLTCVEELVYGDSAHPTLPRGELHTQGPGRPS